MRSVQDALYNWLTIKTVAEARPDDSAAKKLRNRPIHTYMCMECSERIAERTMERHASGNFRLYRDKKVEDDW
ncbi:YlaI family protein [Bacillus sp. B-TM1]